MKKITVLLAMLLVLSLTACNNANENTAVTDNGGNTAVTDTITDTTAPEVEDTTSIPETEDTTAPETQGTTMPETTEPEVTTTPEVPVEDEKNQATTEPDTDDSSVNTETSNPTPAHTHKYTDKVVAPTCEKGGYTVHSCDCGHSYSDKETKATGHSYTEKVVAPTTSAQGYTLHTCSKCGTSYKDNYVDKLPTETKPVDPKPTQPSNPGNVEHEEDGWKPDNYGSGDRVEGNVQEAGQFTDIKDYSRSFYSAGMSAADARSALNNYVGRVYGRRFFSDGISINDADVGKFAKIVARDDGKLGVNVFGWRKSYDSDVIQNTCINMVMEAFYFFTGDKNVAYALWSWVDAMEINGRANSDNYGFHDVVWNDSQKIIEMNGIQIEYVPGSNGNTFYFN